MSVQSFCCCHSSPSPPPSLVQHQLPFRPTLSAVPNPPKALAEINKSRIIACLRAQDSNVAMEAACAALQAGICVLEIVMSTPGVLEVVEELTKCYPSSVIGVGTVLNVKDARKAIKAGAQFLMSPCIVMDILLDLHNSEFLYIPGAMTPTEVLSAHNSGAKMVKIYPVSVLGGDSYISALRRPFSHIPLVASQGISLDSLTQYLKCGASAVVLSDAIFTNEAMKVRNFVEIHRRARLAINKVAELVTISSLP